MQCVILQSVLLSLHTDFVLPDSCGVLLFPPLPGSRVCASANPGFIRPPAGGSGANRLSGHHPRLKKGQTSAMEQDREPTLSPARLLFSGTSPSCITDHLKGLIKSYKVKNALSSFLQKWTK